MLFYMYLINFQFGDADPSDTAATKAGGHFVGSGAGAHGCPDGEGYDLTSPRDEGDMVYIFATS